jgi:hypothetical protein
MYISEERNKKLQSCDVYDSDRTSSESDDDTCVIGELQTVPSFPFRKATTYSAVTGRRVLTENVSDPRITSTDPNSYGTLHKV